MKNTEISVIMCRPISVRDEGAVLIWPNIDSLSSNFFHPKIGFQGLPPPPYKFANEYLKLWINKCLDYYINTET